MIVNWAYVYGVGLIQVALATRPKIGWYYPITAVTGTTADDSATLVPTELLLPTDCECGGTGKVCCDKTGKVRDCDCLVVLMEQVDAKYSSKAPVTAIPAVKVEAKAPAPEVPAAVTPVPAEVVPQTVIVTPVEAPCYIALREQYLGLDVYDVITKGPRPMLVGAILLPQGTDITSLMVSKEFRGTLVRQGLLEVQHG